MNESTLTEIDEIAATGRAVLAGGDDGVVEVVKAAILADVSAAFYLTKDQARAVKEWYWTPERIRKRGLEEVSAKETERIKLELGLDLPDFRFTPKKCECGHLYGAFDFLQQGIKQHGLETVRSVLALRHAVLLQVNPTFEPVCPVDDQPLSLKIELGGIEYEGPTYGGCCCCAGV